MKILRLVSAGCLLGSQLVQAETEVRKAIPVEKPSAPSQGEPEVRKALPVEKPAPTPTPIPAKEPEVRRALPVENPKWMERVVPQPTPTPIPTPTLPPPQTVPVPGPEPGFKPYRPQGRIQVDPTPTPAVQQQAPAAPAPQTPAAPQAPESTAPAPQADEDGSIRLAPTNAAQAADKDQLDRANSFYTRKMYDYAIMEYEKFLITYPQAKGRDMALFRLAECHRMLNNEAAARSSYEKLLMEFREGEFAGAGAYRLGEYLFAERKYDLALGMFQTAAKYAASDEVKLTAKFNAARCLDKMGRPAEAIPLYREVASVEKNNSYHDFALLAIADALASEGKKAEAFAELEKLSSGDRKSPIRAEATVKAAALASELDKPKDATRLFKRALELDDIGDWKSTARIGLLRVSYDSGDFQEVANTPKESLADLPGDAYPEALLLIANAQRMLGNHQQARAAYDDLMQRFPNSKAAKDAQFSRLASLYQLNDPNLQQEVDRFLMSTTDPKLRNQASLLKAESLFKKQDYVNAGKIYQSLMGEDLKPEYKKEALFKLGFCYSQAGNSVGAIGAFSEYLKKYPDSPAAPAALLQLALAEMKGKDYDDAIKDFDKLITSHRDAPERELALQNKALILGQKKDYKPMAETFQTLLKDYPKSAAAGQANFWIGWVAFEDKDYKDAIEGLEAARKLDAKNYGERAALRILLCYYNLQDWKSLEAEVDSSKGVTIAPEIYKQLGDINFTNGDYAKAEKYYTALAKAGGPLAADAQIYLAEALIKQGKFKAAQASAEAAIQAAREPARRARALLALGDVNRDAGRTDEAIKNAEEALLLQPEGRLNAQGRLLLGETEYSKGDFAAAAKAFMTVAVLYDDKVVTPHALERAASAYRKAGDSMEAQKAESELKQRFPDFASSRKVGNAQ